MMPLDDGIVPIILPEPVPLGEDNSAPHSTGATAEDIQHWFELETISREWASATGSRNDRRDGRSAVLSVGCPLCSP
jgi:hypothetical protein